MAAGIPAEDADDKPLDQDNTGAVVLWSLLTALLLGLVAWRGLRTVGMAFGIGVLVLAAALLIRNRSMHTKQSSGRPRGYRIAVIVAVVMCAVVPGTWFVISHIAGTDPAHGGHLWLPRALLLTGAAATAAICLSSLVDWAYTHPHLRGRRDGLRPCLLSTDERWRALTRNWLLHRLISYTVVRLAAGTFAGLLVVGLPSKVPPPLTSVLTGAAALLAAYILGRVTVAASLSQNPPLRVGDVVVLAEEYGTGVRRRPTYYVVDVSLEGVQLRELVRGRPTGTRDRSHDRTLELKDVNRLLRARLPYTGCRPTCSGINKYCPLGPADETPPAPTAYADRLRTPSAA
jgi:hypothetical protein